jgi:cytohesin
MATKADGASCLETLGEKSPATARRESRHFFQFTLRQILLLCALVGVLLCLVAPRIRWNFHVRRIQEDFRRREAAEAKLREAIRKNDVPLARQLLESGADPDLDFHARRLSRQSPSPSVLNTCIANGQVEMMELLLEFGADIRRIEGIPAKSSNAIHMGPPLFAAAGCNQPAEVREKMVRLLVKRGANPRLFVYGHSAMDMAFETSDAPMGDLLREFGLPYGPREMAAFNRLDELKAAVQETPEILQQRFRSAYADHAPSLLAIALRRGYREMSLFLIEAGAPLDVMDGSYTLLHDAARGGDPQLIRLLVERGLDVNAKDRYSDTPICDIAWNGKPEAIAALVELGADVNWQGVNGQTPLHHAVRNNQRETVRLLLAAGADPSLSDGKGETPLELSKSRSAEIAKLSEQAAQDK